MINMDKIKTEFKTSYFILYDFVQKKFINICPNFETNETRLYKIVLANHFDIDPFYIDYYLKNYNLTIVESDKQFIIDNMSEFNA